MCVVVVVVIVNFLSYAGVLRLLTLSMLSHAHTSTDTKHAITRTH